MSAQEREFWFVLLWYEVCFVAHRVAPLLRHDGGFALLRGPVVTLERLTAVETGSLPPRGVLLRCAVDGVRRPHQVVPDLGSDELFAFVAVLVGELPHVALCDEAVVLLVVPVLTNESSPSRRKCSTPTRA